MVLNGSKAQLQTVLKDGKHLDTMLQAEAKPP